MKVSHFLDRLLGKKTVKASDDSSGIVLFHVIGPDGSETRQLRVGIDIPDAQYTKLADAQTGALYGLTVYEGGVSKTNVVPRQIWEQAKAQFGEIDRLHADAMRKIKDQLDNA